MSEFSKSNVDVTRLKTVVEEQIEKLQINIDKAQEIYNNLKYSQDLGELSKKNVLNALYVSIYTSKNSLINLYNRLSNLQIVLEKIKMYQELEISSVEDNAKKVRLANLENSIISLLNEVDYE